MPNEQFCARSHRKPVNNFPVCPPVARCTSLALLVAAGILCMTGCSSDDDDVATVTVEGTVFANAVSGGHVTVQTPTGETVAGPVLTDGTGQYELAIPESFLGQPLLVVAQDGSYADEATGSTTTLERLAAYVDALETDPINLTAGSTIVASLVADHALTGEVALQRFETAFGFHPDPAVVPARMSEAQAETDSDASIAGMMAAGFSQLLQELGLPATAHHDLLQALADDLSDGTADGMADGELVEVPGQAGANLPRDIRSRFGSALIDFASDTERNRSGIHVGALPGIAWNSSAWSSHYRFDLTPPETGAKVGKSPFTLRVRDHDGAAVTGVVPQLSLLMYMANGHNHRTPSAGCTITDSNGDAVCTPYFVMASGVGMGHWRMTFTVQDEPVDFFPAVAMAMGDTQRAQLKGTGTDVIGGMGGMTSARSYNLFRDDLAADGMAYRMTFFVSTVESMMSFPALVAGQTLNAETDYELTPETILVEVSLDKIDWSTAESLGSGLWSAGGLALTADALNSVYVRLTVNGEVKTTNGLTLTDENQAAKFDVTPGGGMMMGM